MSFSEKDRVARHDNNDLHAAQGAVLSLDVNRVFRFQQHAAEVLAKTPSYDEKQGSHNPSEPFEIHLLFGIYGAERIGY